MFACGDRLLVSAFFLSFFLTVNIVCIWTSISSTDYDTRLRFMNPDTLQLNILEECENPHSTKPEFPQRRCAISKPDYDQLYALAPRVTYHFRIADKHYAFVAGRKPVPLGPGLFEIKLNTNTNHPNLVYVGPVRTDEVPPLRRRGEAKIKVSAEDALPKPLEAPEEEEEEPSVPETSVYDELVSVATALRDAHLDKEKARLAREAAREREEKAVQTEKEALQALKGLMKRLHIE